MKAVFYYNDSTGRISYDGSLETFSRIPDIEHQILPLVLDFFDETGRCEIPNLALVCNDMTEYLNNFVYCVDDADDGMPASTVNVELFDDLLPFANEEFSGMIIRLTALICQWAKEQGLAVKFACTKSFAEKFAENESFKKLKVNTEC